ncbi:transmembrane protein 254 [Iamia sp. SCSIO 61187]|uniref:CRISPR-associated protein Cas5 n=1 Tax=Iamia sp. SCSIO 61187 TaxID=2722752 RepID=UPI001C630716|nr:CRISPR-associated protein Cas5 [Iamia sp. SCSIO 61187]QYG95233.1 transmembrane protein 254 [Iamia sp. SCSIO 61187]
MALAPPSRPALAWFAVLDGGVAALSVLALSPAAYDAARRTVPLPSRTALQGLLGLTGALHVGEAIYARRTAARHGLAVGPWTRQTFVVGFPSLLALRRTIAAT